MRTIEPNAEWLEALQASTKERFAEEVSARLRTVHATGTAGIEAIRELEDGHLDLAIIDPKGQEISRYDALMVAKKKLRQGGWLVLDNSDHPNNLAAVEALGTPHKVVTGYGAMCLVVTQTTFWRITS